MVELSLQADKPYLKIPTRSDAPYTWVSLYEGERLVYEFYTRMDWEKPDFWSVCHMAPFMGKTLRVRVEGPAEGAAELRRWACSAAFPGQEALYREPERQRLHFSAQRGYIGDPNGLFYYAGRYHLFFQLNPYANDWGDWQDHVNMSWGHAVSADLVHWTEHPPVLYPDGLGPAFSGSAVVDVENASGLQEGADPPILLYYTAAGGQARRTRHLKHTQCLAVSTDGGHSFHPYPGNPLLENVAYGNRDPSLFYHEGEKCWLMLLYTDTEEKYLVFSSRDLLHFAFLSEIQWDNRECPDLMELAVEGTAERQLILWGARGRYMPVEFDGKRLIPAGPVKQCAANERYLSAQVFRNLPDGRCIQMGLIPHWKPAAAFGNCMSVPLELKLYRDGEGYTAGLWPAAELSALRESVVSLGPQETGGQRVYPGFSCMDVEITLSVKGVFRLLLNGAEIVIDAPRRTLTCAETSLDLRRDGRLELRILADGDLFELFEGSRHLYLPFSIAEEKEKQLLLEGDGTVERLEIFQMTDMWTKEAQHA